MIPIVDVGANGTLDLALSAVREDWLLSMPQEEKSYNTAEDNQ